MATWIALLRGINVGGNNMLPMKTWAAQLAELERQRALKGEAMRRESPSRGTHAGGNAPDVTPPEKDRLDRLVDEVDRLDL